MFQSGYTSQPILDKLGCGWLHLATPNQSMISDFFSYAVTISMQKI